MRVEFLEDFAIYKKKDKTELRNTLAARLIKRKIVKEVKQSKTTKK